MDIITPQMFLNPPEPPKTPSRLSRLMHPESALKFIAVVSLLALGTAFTAEYAFGLKPCILCLYQRIPFVVAFMVSASALIWIYCRFRCRKSAAKRALNNSHVIALYLLPLFICLLAFMANFALALHHSGVEQGWWDSFSAGCQTDWAVTSGQDLLNTIMQAPAVRCDAIPWADPILGLSMAAYNTFLCMFMIVFCCIALIFFAKK